MSSEDDRRESETASITTEAPGNRDRNDSASPRISTPQVVITVPCRPRQAPRLNAAGRTCEVLDLAIDTLESSEAARNAMSILVSAKRIIFIAGAGISVAAGIPDFRSPAGLFSTLKADTKYKPSGKALFDASVYKSDVGTQSYNEMITSLHSLTTAAKPTSFHTFLDSISHRIQRIYSQNIDSLENRFTSLSTKVPLPTKGPWPKTVQLHGDLKYAVCSKCHWLGPLDPKQLSLGAEMGCMQCREADDVRQVVGKRCQGVGIIRPRVVLYNEANPDADAIGAVSNADIRSRPPPDLVLVVGTSLKIPGTKRIARETINVVHHTPRGKAIWVNLDPPPSKDYDIWIKGDCQRIPALYEGYERMVEHDKILKTEELKRKEERKSRAIEERMEKRAREKLRKEQNELGRQRRKELKEQALAEKEQRGLERKRRKAEKQAEKARRELERAIRPIKKVKKEEKRITRPLTPPLTYDTDSTLSSPSISDIEFATFVESASTKPVPTTPSTTRVIEYLPTPAPTPQKRQHNSQEQVSPLNDKKRKLQYTEECNNNPSTEEEGGQRVNSMSINFLMDSG